MRGVGAVDTGGEEEKGRVEVMVSVLEFARFG
jgi:hypothetical protein